MENITTLNENVENEKRNRPLPPHIKTLQVDISFSFSIFEFSLSLSLSITLSLPISPYLCLFSVSRSVCRLLCVIVFEWYLNRCVDSFLSNRYSCMWTSNQIMTHRCFIYVLYNRESCRLMENSFSGVETDLFVYFHSNIVYPTKRFQLNASKLFICSSYYVWVWTLAYLR